MHPSSQLRMEWFVNTYLNQKRKRKLSVLDVGSYDVNGSYKEYFPTDRFSYTGLDMQEGPNVDVVAQNPYSWSCLKDESFDVVISGQAFEHIEFFWFTLAEMLRVLKRGGFLCIVAPRLHERHRYPVDTYRFDTDGMIALGRYGNLKILHASMNMAPLGAPKEWYSRTGDAMLVAVKPLKWKGMLHPKDYTYVPADIEKLAGGFVEVYKQPYFRAKEENELRTYARKMLQRIAEQEGVGQDA